MRTEAKYYFKLQILHSLIKKEKTGTPCSLSTKMHISRRTFFYMIDDLREMGAVIKYCRKRQTYCYEREFDLKIEYKISVTIDGNTKIIEKI